MVAAVLIGTSAAGIVSALPAAAAVAATYYLDATNGNDSKPRYHRGHGLEDAREGQRQDLRGGRPTCC